MSFAAKLQQNTGQMRLCIKNWLMFCFIIFLKCEKPVKELAMAKNEKKAASKKKPIKQAEVWANRDIPDDAQEISQPGPTYDNPNANEVSE